MNDVATSRVHSFEKKEGYINYKELPVKKAVVKFYNPEEDKRFGFLTVLGANDKKLFDAYLSGAILEKAGIYELFPGDFVNIRHVPKDKGEAVVFIQRFNPKLITVIEPPPPPVPPTPPQVIEPAAVEEETTSSDSTEE